MAEDLEAGDDIGWWNCSLCTYKNAADKFKCEICDLRRGTSTRKPRCNADTIVAQVVKQQEQIRQQTKAKPSPKASRTSTSSNLVAATSSNDSSAKTKLFAKKSGRLENNAAPLSDSSQSVSSPKPKKRKATSKNSKSSRRGVMVNDDHRVEIEDAESTESDSSEATDELSPQRIRMDSDSSLSDSHYSSSSATSPEPTTSSPNPSVRTRENPFKITPLEVSGNLIKYSPPTSTGRTGLIIDKKRFTQHSVTVNDVTITFTEFATRQNKYIRKKKNRRPRNKIV